MKDLDMENYRMLMEGVKTPGYVVEGIRSESESLRNEERRHRRSPRKAAAPSSQGKLRRLQKRRVLPGLAAAACVIALVVGITFAFPLLSSPEAEKEPTMPGVAPTEPTNSGNFFTLLAYPISSPLCRNRCSPSRKFCDIRRRRYCPRANAPVPDNSPAFSRARKNLSSSTSKSIRGSGCVAAR